MKYSQIIYDKIECTIPIVNLLKSKQATPSPPSRPITIVGAEQRGFVYANYTKIEPQWAKVVAIAEPIEFRRNKIVKEKYGNIFELYLGFNRKIIVGDIKLLEEIYVKSTESLFYKRIIPGVDLLDMSNKGTVFNNEISSYKRNKQLFVYNLEKVARQNVTSMCNIVENFFKDNNKENEYELDFKDWIMGIWFKIIILHYIFPKFAMDYLSFLSKLKDGYIQEAKSLKENLNQQIDFKRVKISEEIKHSTDILSLLIRKDINKENILNITNEMINGSVITTTNTIIFLVYQIYKNPKVKDIIYSELENVLGSKTYFMSYDKIKGLKYVDACVKKSLCLITVLLFSSRCIASNGIISGLHWKEKQEFVIHHNYIHQSTKYWVNPSLFKPEKFMVNNIRKNRFIPFGGGIRECPGRNLAILAIKIVLIKFLDKFVFELVEPDNILKPEFMLVKTFGNLYCFAFKELRQMLLKLQERYGGIFELYVGVNRKIIVGDSRLLDVIYNKSSDSIFRYCTIPGMVSLGMDSTGTVFNNLSSYKKNRQLFVHILAKGSKKCMINIMDVIKKVFDKNDQREIFKLDLNIWMLDIFAKIFMNIILGKTISENILRRILYLPKRMALWFKVTGLYYVLPNGVVDNIPFSRKMRERFIEQDRDFRDEINYLIELKRKEILGSDENNDEQNSDALTMLVKEDINSKLYSDMDDTKSNNENMIRIINEMINGGVIMTVNSVKFLIYQICKHPMVKERWKEEQEFIIHHNYILQDAKYWKNLQLFIPERFIEGDDIIKNSFIPFGSGFRKCSGKNLATFVIKLVLILFLKRYDIELVDPEVPLKTKFILVNECIEMKVRIKLRSK
ncbi:384_t:CDS:2 [Dentiscutata erythropus]|uniref:384_t:CDS:1 n=1 Tax=Dentiscutata erythropus TaxID=1348616 RepID=A0A9N9A2F0_9GLOM|nr:384_t:CDS:2 [Dentiscutata erythropus]